MVSVLRNCERLVLAVGSLTAIGFIASIGCSAGDKAAQVKPVKCEPRVQQKFIDVKRYPPLGLTVKQAIHKFGSPSRKLLRAEFRAINKSYPPEKLALIAFKKERVLLLYNDGEAPKFVRSFPLVSYSGVLGPKLKEGDLQIPEGLYRITNLQAHTRLALGVDYPNLSDRKRAAQEHRTNLGGNILVHGGFVSTGCLVVSNEDMQQIFTAVYDVGCNRTKLLIAPCDLRRENPDVDLNKQPKWLPALYRDLTKQLKKYP